MAEYRSPSGEVLEIPDKGVAAMRALGWEPVKVAEPAPKRASAEKKQPSRK